MPSHNATNKRSGGTPELRGPRWTNGKICISKAVRLTWQLDCRVHSYVDPRERLRLLSWQMDGTYGTWARLGVQNTCISATNICKECFRISSSRFTFSSHPFTALHFSNFKYLIFTLYTSIQSSVRMRFSSLVFTCIATLAFSASAHPGHDLSEELAERAAFFKATRNTNLAHCADKIETRGLVKRNAVRRSVTVNDSRKKREHMT